MSDFSLVLSSSVNSSMEYSLEDLYVKDEIPPTEVLRIFQKTAHQRSNYLSFLSMVTRRNLEIIFPWLARNQINPIYATAEKGSYWLLWKSIQQLLNHDTSKYFLPHLRDRINQNSDLQVRKMFAYLLDSEDFVTRERFQRWNDHLQWSETLTYLSQDPLTYPFYLPHDLIRIFLPPYLDISK